MTPVIIPLLITLIATSSGINRTTDPDLTALAQVRVTEYATGQYGGTHRDLDELDNGRWSSWGEVLGWNRFYPSADTSVQAVVEGWMESPTHHSILVAPQYDSVGCAFAVGESEDHEAWYVCIFADRARTTDKPSQTPEYDIGEPATLINPDLLPDTAMAAPR